MTCLNFQETTVTGKSKGQSKKPITQQKLGIIKSIFNERLTAMRLRESPKNLRMKRLNSLVKSAITNILTKEKQTENELGLNVQPGVK